MTYEHSDQLAHGKERRELRIEFWEVKPYARDNDQDSPKVEGSRIKSRGFSGSSSRVHSFQRRQMDTVPASNRKE